jgi:hypothetical protein
LVAFFCTGIVLNGCDKSDDSPGTSHVNSVEIKVDNGSAYSPKVSTVKALADIGVSYESGNYYWTGFELDDVPYNNGVFSIDLTKKEVPANRLSSFYDEYSSDDVKVSDQNAKGTSAIIVGYNRDGKEAGVFWYENNSNKAWLMYADRDVTITGTKRYEEGNNTLVESYNVSLKKGWNIWYNYKSADGNTLTASTSNPGGFKWVFQEGDTE